MRLIFLLCLILTLADASSKKVIFLTIPKSGTWMLEKTIEKLTGKSPQPLENLEMGPVQVENLEEYLLSIDLSVFISHLFPLTQQIRTFNSERFTKVLLVRDPRDVMVSFVNHLILQYPWPFSHVKGSESFSLLPFDEQLEQVLLFPPLGPRESIFLTSAWLKDSDVHIIRFEDLVGKAGGGSDEAQWATLITLTELLEINVSEEKLKEVAASLFGGTRSFHKGQIGAWKDSYSAENKALFKCLLGQATIDLGYATDLNW